ncbi:CRP/FNR family transcriptional regulator [Mesorhizobium alhagi CCNWXJ12-2]|uniref:CRP/FNR family transcriptional regulator n=1 Tax=Mesorhizobium alhagi CCNWXJ12-2 TaxID=1107882 RepID=H0I2G7_9HYPH|nr:CRP/FNR family transcriptional regulator [Mesorhizobium alhagi CCNWXJ12-2]
MQTLLQFVRAHPIGVSLTEDEREAYAFLNVAAKRYRSHTVISRQDDTDERIFIVKSGWGCLYRELHNGGRQIIDTPLRGDIIGVRAVDGPNYATLSAISELSLFEVPKRALDRAMLLHQAIGSTLTRAIARQNSILAEHLINAGRRNAITRTAHLLLELEERLAAYGLAARGRFDCPLTQQDLADILGLTAVHVSRTFGALRKADIASFKAGSVEIINRTKLMKLSSFDSEYLRLT